VLATLNLIAAFNGALVGVVLLAQERFGPVRTRTSLAGFLLLVSALLALFVLLDTGQVRYSLAIGIAMDVAALLCGALLLDYVSTSVSQRGFGLWPYAPPLLYLIAASIKGAPLFPPADLAPIVAMQIAYSAVAIWVYLRARPTLPPDWSKRSEHLHLPVLLAGLVLLHIAQAVRLATPGNDFLYDLVPLIGALGLIAFAVYAMIGSQTLRSLAAHRVPATADDTFGAALDAKMAESRACLDPDLSLPKAAALMKTTTQRLSAYLNTQRGLNFRAYVNSLRIAEAKRLLRDPAEARTSIEAIAQLVGFRSRSSFYAAFQAQVGMSPQDYRSKSGEPA
jgi:AraC-like DNA-binding protein